MNQEILCKCLLERKDEILAFTNFTSLVLISTMIALLAILFIIKLYARNNTFKLYHTPWPNKVLREVHLESSAKRGTSAVEAMEWAFGARLKACLWDSPSIESQQTNLYRDYLIGSNLKGDQPNS